MKNDKSDQTLRVRYPTNQDRKTSAVSPISEHSQIVRKQSFNPKSLSVWLSNFTGDLANLAFRFSSHRRENFDPRQKSPRAAGEKHLSHFSEPPEPKNMLIYCKTTA